MNHFTKSITAFILLFCMVARAQTVQEQVEPMQMSLPEAYSRAEATLYQGQFREAVQLLEQLEKHYPYGSHAASVQLYLAYAYYQTSEWLLSQTIIARFMRLHTADHPHTDYILYLQALNHMAQQGSSLLQRLDKTERATRDPNDTQHAFYILKNLVAHHPDSLYATDAHARLVHLKNQLAHYELAIARYYQQRKVYIAVVNRVLNMLKWYPDTTATRKALPLLKETYQRLQLKKAASEVNMLIQSNPAP